MDKLWMTHHFQIPEIGIKNGAPSRLGVNGDRLLVLTQEDGTVLLTIASLTEQSVRTLRLEDPKQEIHFVQELDEGYLLVAAFSKETKANAFFYNGEGRLRYSFHAGDAIENVQVCADCIWIGYMEDGIEGGDPLSEHGAVCLARDGSLLFSYREAALKQGLPPIKDCYGLNMAPTGEVWVYYFTDHILARMDSLRVRQFWKGGPVLSWRSPLVQAGGFARWERRLLFATPRRHLYRGSLSRGALERVMPVDESGEELSFDRWWTRDSRLFLADGEEVYSYNMKGNALH